MTQDITPQCRRENLFGESFENGSLRSLGFAPSKGSRPLKIGAGSVVSSATYATAVMTSYTAVAICATSPSSV